jgi:molybdopterin molybdotransferase
MISYATAQDIISQQAAKHLNYRTVPLLEASGGICAQKLTSAINLPPFRNAAMDGFAVRSETLKDATPDHPVRLDITATILAGGHVPDTTQGISRIMTGAQVPACYDGVIPVEHVTSANGQATFTRPCQAQENIRAIGEDVKQGDVILNQGERITPEHIMLLAACGYREVEICKLPDIYIFSTGNELILPLNNEQPLPQGRTFNSNTPYLLAKARQYHVTAHDQGIIADDSQAFEEAVEALPPDSIIISSGAVSKGDKDFIPHSLSRLGATLHFHRVNIRPGKPVLFAGLPNGSLYFGLPGNPISTGVGFEFFIVPLLCALQSVAAPQPIMAKLSADFHKKGDFRQFLKSTLRIDQTGQLEAIISQGQESFKIASLAQANAWVSLDENTTHWRAHEIVPVFLHKEFTWQR